MSRKIIGMLVCALFIGTVLPVTATHINETDTETLNDATSDSAMLCHVVAKGIGSCATFYGTFVLGVGYCLAMLVTLEGDGYIEITSLLDPSNTTTLEGSHRVFIIGFVGLRWNIPKVNVNGLALLAVCS